MPYVDAVVCVLSCTGRGLTYASNSQASKVSWQPLQAGLGNFAYGPERTLTAALGVGEYVIHVLCTCLHMSVSYIGSVCNRKKPDIWQRHLMHLHAPTSIDLQVSCSSEALKLMTLTAAKFHRRGDAVAMLLPHTHTQVDLFCALCRLTMFSWVWQR